MFVNLCSYKNNCPFYGASIKIVVYSSVLADSPFFYTTGPLSWKVKFCWVAAAH